MATTTDTKATPTKTSYTIREAARYLGKSEMYLRKKINDGTIPSKKVQLIGNIMHHVIQKADLDTFKARSSNRSSRDDGRNKFTVYMTPVEEARVRALFKENKLEAVAELLQRANPGKNAK